MLQTFPAGGNWGDNARERLAFSRDGNRLAFVKNGRFAYVWDLKTEKLLRRIDHADWGWQGFCAFTPDGLLALAEKEKLRFFDPATGTEKRAIGVADVLALSPDGKYVAHLASRSERTVPVSLADAVTGKDLHTFETAVGPWSGVSFTPDGKRLTLVTPDGTAVEVWDTDKRVRVACLETHRR